MTDSDNPGPLSGFTTGELWAAVSLLLPELRALTGELLERARSGQQVNTRQTDQMRQQLVDTEDELLRVLQLPAQRQRVRFVVSAVDYTLTDADDAFLQAIGYSRAEALGGDVAALVLGGRDAYIYRPDLIRQHHELRLGRISPFRYRGEMFSRLGKPIEIDAEVTWDAATESWVTEGTVLLHDATLTLEPRELRYSVNEAGNFTAVNDLFCQCFGYARAELLGALAMPILRRSAEMPETEPHIVESYRRLRDGTTREENFRSWFESRTGERFAGTVTVFWNRTYREWVTVVILEQTYREWLTSLVGREAAS